MYFFKLLFYCSYITGILCIWQITRLCFFFAIFNLLYMRQLIAVIFLITIVFVTYK